ncbi:hypothetical protein G6L32_14380 [Agrobacterium tumefaciens]|uniref:hypothetical protein n=1 Tax=Agrobacterium tumefaciens TaxID=358 RepID=UPI0015731FDC|nr:hypothetical protein [Agrobacterium tumefaciens]
MKTSKHQSLLTLAAGAMAITMLWPGFGAAGAISVRTQRECRDPTPAQTLDEMFAAIYGCWTPPPESVGMGVALRFMLLRDGQLKGKIVVDWISPHENSPAREAFVQSTMEAVRRASPVPLGEALQETVPGRVLRQKFALPDGATSAQDY